MTAAGAPTLTRGRTESGTMLLDRPVDFGGVFDVPDGPDVERIVDITTPPRISAFPNATIVAAGHERDDPEDSLVPPTCAGADVRTEAEFTDLYEKHFSELAAQVCAYLGDATEAQDLVQEAFLRAWQRWDKVGGYEEPVAWVRRVAWNLATSRHRRNQVARKFLQKSSAPELSPAASPDHVALVAALKLVPAKRRQALVMHYMADMTVSAIAAATGAKEGTVKSWLHRGRKELAALLTDEAAEAKPAKAAAPADPDTMPIRIKRAIPGARAANRRASVKEDRS
ncbi:RNA polymerase sigma factor [Glycomyces sp. YM15]|uniref:RNA polymerase sigma factor n=1 Tax=Glycomyces sp. YM15 TaxID=2800446 RepID=UPI0019628DC1|nr:SigE family RNA polymerase sigma factor [Glycomyces sp. YM15]